MTLNEQYSAAVEIRLGPDTKAPATRVRDVIVCPTDPSGPVGDVIRDHPPIGSSAFFRGLVGADPQDLGRGVRIEHLPRDEATLVMNACSPRGHHFVPMRQFGQRYSFVLELDVQEWHENPFRWDPDGLLWDALALSRLIRDNGCSTEYAARIVDYEDGQQTVVYALGAESKNIYRLRKTRDWLDAVEGQELRDLLEAYWATEAAPERVRRAAWRAEWASWLRWADLAIPILVSGLESLLKTDHRRATRQFVHRATALAHELSIEGVTTELCEEMYDARSGGSTVHRSASSRRQRRDRRGPNPKRENSPGSPFFKTFSELGFDGASRTWNFERSSPKTGTSVAVGRCPPTDKRRPRRRAKCSEPRLPHFHERFLRF